MNFERIAQGLLLAEEQPPGGINGLIPFMWLIPVIILYVFLIQRPLTDEFILFNVFRYLTFRSGAAATTEHGVPRKTIDQGKE